MSFKNILILTLITFVTLAHAEDKEASISKGVKTVRAAPKGYISQGGLTWMPTSSSTRTWQDANSYCNSPTINGQNGWRLPTKDELKALYKSGMKDGWWVFGRTWSSTPSNTGGHYVVSLDRIGVFDGDDTDTVYVTCVRRVTESVQTKQNQKAAAPKANFVSQGGLTWMPVNNSRKTWSDANAYCNKIEINGQTGWRLPTKDELSALYESGAMKGQGLTSINTWSSTPYGVEDHYSVIHGFGNVSRNGDTDTVYVTCVRLE